MGNKFSSSSSNANALTKNGYVPDTPENNASHHRYKTPIKRNEACLTRIAYINRILSFCCDEVIVAIKMSHVCEAYRETLVRFGTEIWQQVVSEIYKEPGFQTNFLFTLQHPDLCWVVRAVYERGELDKNFMFLGCKPALWQAVRSKNLGAIHVLVEEAGEYSSSDDDDDDHNNNNENETHQEQVETATTTTTNSITNDEMKRLKILKPPKKIDLNKSGQSTSQDAGLTPLAIAVKNVNTDIIRYLIVHGALCMTQATPPQNASPSRTTITTALFTASQQNNSVTNVLSIILQALGRNHPMINYASQGHTPLLQAIRTGHFDNARLLLDFGANPNIITTTNSTGVFHVLPKQGNVANNSDGSMSETESLAKSLIAAGADIDYRTPGDGRTGLYHQLSKGPSDSCADTLIRLGADVNICEKTRGISPLIAAIEYCENPIVAQVIEKGANLDYRETGGMRRTALLTAVVVGNVTKAEMLLKAGCDKELPDILSNCSPLAVAVCQGDKNMAELLLKEGCDVMSIPGKANPNSSILSSNVNINNMYMQPRVNMGSNVRNFPLAILTSHQQSEKEKNNRDDVDCFYSLEALAEHLGHERIVELIKRYK